MSAHEIVIRDNDRPGGPGLIALFDSVGWSAYTALEHCRRQVLLTDDEPRQRAFYESLGYHQIRDVGQGRLRAFVRFRRPVGD